MRAHAGTGRGGRARRVPTGVSALGGVRGKDHISPRPCALGACLIGITGQLSTEPQRIGTPGGEEAEVVMSGSGSMCPTEAQNGGSCGAARDPRVTGRAVGNKVTVVLGAQWGDEGKGKVVDLLAQDADIVCRCQVSRG